MWHTWCTHPFCIQKMWLARQHWLSFSSWKWHKRLRWIRHYTDNAEQNYKTTKKQKTCKQSSLYYLTRWHLRKSYHVVKCNFTSVPKQQDVVLWRNGATFIQPFLAYCDKASRNKQRMFFSFSVENCSSKAAQLTMSPSHRKSQLLSLTANSKAACPVNSWGDSMSTWV